MNCEMILVAGVDYRCSRCGFTRSLKYGPDGFNRRCSTAYKRAGKPTVRSATQPKTTGKPCGTCGPGILKTAANAVKAAGRVAGAVVSGEPVTVDAATAAIRLEVCQTCSRFDGQRCMECGCFVAAKATLATEDCPLDRWAERDFAGARRPLFRLTHGLGDSVQFTVALRHLRAAFPGRPIAVQACDSLAAFFRPLVDRVYGAGDRIPPGEHDYIEDCPWNVPEFCYADTPSTKAERWLRERGITPQADLCRYWANPRPEAIAAAREYLAEIDATDNAVLIHHTGRTARNRKTLPAELWVGLCERLQLEGFTPIVLDWECHGRPGATVGLPGTHNPGRGHWLWHGWDRCDAERLVALASLARACVGIDSGPGHLFQASGAPTVIAWTRHHPINFAPLSGSAVHLVPEDHARWIKGFTDERLPAAHRAAEFFAANYAHRTYLWPTLPETLTQAVLSQARSGRLRGSDPVLSDTPSLSDDDLRINVGRGIAWQADASVQVLYDRDYFDKYAGYAKNEKEAAIGAFRQRFAGHYARSILDLGIGCGTFAGAWCGGPSFGWDVNPAAVEWLTQRGKLLEPTPENLRRVQAVTAWDSFEHLPEPSRLLDAMHAGQYLILSLPIFDDVRRIRESRHYRPGEHLTYWTAHGLRGYLDRAGFDLLATRDDETRAGREAIQSFAFRKRPYAAPVKSALITGGIGDWFAVEQLLTGEQRDALETVYYATRQHRPIRLLWNMLPNYPRLKEHVVLTDDWSRRFCYVSKWELAQRLGRDVPADADWSIKAVFAEHERGERELRQSSLLMHSLPCDLPELPEQYCCAQYESPNDARLQRDVRPKERPAIDAWASLRGLPIVSLDMTSGHTLPQAIEILKRASGYIGIDSCFSVLAARLFDSHNLKIRSVNQHLFKNVGNYYPALEPGQWVAKSFA